MKNKSTMYSLQNTKYEPFEFKPFENDFTLLATANELFKPFISFAE